MQGRPLDERELLDAESVAGHLVEPGSVSALLAEHRRVLFPTAMFADLFPSGRGRPSVPADIAASVLVLQSLHGLSDREAMAAVRTDLRWNLKGSTFKQQHGINFHPALTNGPHY